ncbi:MAG: tRNA (5-methylaminomethyl-2-thiouridine)(34)-methyltransferase MnmD [Pseudomonadota bacterium]
MSSAHGAACVPVSARFDDTYFSVDDGWAETRDVFLGGNGLPKRWRDHRSAPFRIGELGFGTGLNFFATLLAWEASHETRCASTLTFVSFEKYPLRRDEMSRALSVWPEIMDVAAPWLEALEAVPISGDQDAIVRIDDCTLELVVGDARERISEMRTPVDAWYLDGFSPAKNPELWEDALLAELYARTVPGGTFSTYTAAGFVRRGLAHVGFEVSRVAGFGRKRERLQGFRPAA